MTFASPSLPALVALVFKLALLGYALRSPTRNRITRLYLALLIVFSLQNAVEFFGLNDFARADYRYANLFGTAYFALVIPFLAIVLHLSLRLSYEPAAMDRYRRFLPLIYVPTGLIEILLLNGQLVAGFTPFQYSILRVPGPYYFLFETYATLYMLMALVSMVYGARRTRPSLARTRNRLWLVGLLPIVLLVIYLVVANHFGWTRLTSTLYLPIAITLFLIVTTYATYEYRLFDIQYYIPWSKVRRRKTTFHRRIQALIAEIADMGSVNKLVLCISETLRCPVVLIGGPKPALAMAGEAFGLARFPVGELKKIDNILVANEIAETMPETYALMKRHKVATIVPFHPHSEAAASWMLLGEAFSEHVYTPLDFQVVESLFDRLADHFLDKQLLLRSQLSEAQREMQLLQERLATAWEQLEVARRKQKTLEEENHRLRRKGAQLLRHELTDVVLRLTDEAMTGNKTLDDYGAEFEARLLERVLQHCDGDRERAAQMLGVTPYTLHQKIACYGLKNN